MQAGNRRYLWIAVLVILLAGVALVAFGLGTAAGNRGWFDNMPMRGFVARGQGVGAVAGMGAGLGGLIWLLLLVGLGLLFLVGLVKVFDERNPPPTGTSQSPTMPSPPTSPTAMDDGIDRLRELAELHDRGKLTDEEFTAAKRRLLGL